MSSAGFNDVILRPCIYVIAWRTGDLTSSYNEVHSVSNEIFTLLSEHIYMYSIYIAGCTVVGSPTVIRQMSLVGFNDVILRPCIYIICWRTVGDVTTLHMHLAIQVHSISFFLSLLGNNYMVII